MKLEMFSVEIWMIGLFSLFGKTFDVYIIDNEFLPNWHEKTCSALYLDGEKQWDTISFTRIFVEDCFCLKTHVQGPELQHEYNRKYTRDDDKWHQQWRTKHFVFVYLCAALLATCASAMRTTMWVFIDTHLHEIPAALYWMHQGWVPRPNKILLWIKYRQLWTACSRRRENLFPSPSLSHTLHHNRNTPTY